MLAERYKDEWIVAGYDLLNEPLPEWFSEYNDQVMPLYRDIIKAIREVDERHMIILEGVHWATDWSIFTEVPDGNLMLQFHKYWNNPDTESIQPYLDKREEWNVPLYMGEGGENNKDWYTGAFTLFEDHDISWNFWTWKKLDTDNSPCSINLPKDWQLLIDYLEGGEKPEPEKAQEILAEYLDNLLLDNCTYYKDVVDALLRRSPVRIPAIFYGYKGADVSFGRTSEPQEVSRISFRESDGMDIRFISSELTAPNFQHGRGESWRPEDKLCLKLATGEWTVYEFTVPAAVSSFELKLRLLLHGESSSLAVSLDERLIGTVSGSDHDWTVTELTDEASLEAGTHRIIARAVNGPVSLEWLYVTSPIL
jgi:endoglucanase